MRDEGDSELGRKDMPCRNEQFLHALEHGKAKDCTGERTLRVPVASCGMSMSMRTATAGMLGLYLVKVLLATRMT